MNRNKSLSNYIKIILSLSFSDDFVHIQSLSLRLLHRDSHWASRAKNNQTVSLYIAALLGESSFRVRTVSLQVFYAVESR